MTPSRLQGELSVVHVNLNKGVSNRWTGPLDLATGLTVELILGVLRNLLIFYIIELSVFLVSAASTTATNYNNTWTSTATVQTSW